MNRALGRANIPAVKEPVGLLRSDGKRPDGLTQIPWQAGKSMTWDDTVTDTLAESYLLATSSTARAAAEDAADRKELKYQRLAYTNTFCPMAFETLRLSIQTRTFLTNLINVYQLALATCEKLRSYFSVCR